VSAFSPYGAETGAMWHAFRRFTRERVSDPDRVVAAAGATFRSLAAWCAPVTA
jgi:heme oxygenase